MPLYEYLCEKCNQSYNVDKPVAQVSNEEHCECGETLRRVYTAPRITGTRDSFGVGKGFYCQYTKKYITDFKTWERAGYKEPTDDPNLPHHMKEKIKEKVKKIKYYKSRGIDPGGKTGIPGTK